AARTPNSYGVLGVGFIGKGRRAYEDMPTVAEIRVFHHRVQGTVGIDIVTGKKHGDLIAGASVGSPRSGSRLASTHALRGRAPASPRVRLTTTRTNACRATPYACLSAGRSHAGL